jgi:hypothetical protein
MTDYCVTLARLAHEPLIGTAGRNDFHLVMAWPKREWQAKVEDMPGPPGQMAALVGPLKDIAQFSLCEAPPQAQGRLWLFPHGLMFDLDPSDYPRLLEQALNGQMSLPAQRIPEKQVILLCTHGKRDLSCAKFGEEVLRALKALAGPELGIWEGTHIGGHRFAGTAVVYPHSQWYGFLTAAEVPAWVAAIQAGQVMTTHYRGNANYAPPLQVAEAWGWEQLQAAGQTGQVYLLNPQVNGEQAQVEVVMTGPGHHRHSRLILTSQPYEFIADTGSAQTKKRQLWQLSESHEIH